MKHLLVIDNHIDLPHGVPEIPRGLGLGMAAGEKMQILVRRGPESGYSLATSELLGVVISGSKTRVLENAPWIDRQMQFVRKLRADGIPMLGICYGEQIIAKTFGGDSHVRTAPVCEFGFVRLQRDDLVDDRGVESAILKGLPAQFHSFCYHYDEVSRLPEGFRITASSAACAIHAIEATDGPMWGVQFHPEKNLSECRASMANIQKNDPAVPLLNADHAEKMYDPNVAKVIFTNFLNEVRKRQS